MAKETDRDETLVAMKNMIIKGWTDKMDECPMMLKEYRTYRDELSILDRLVFKGTRIVILKHCQNELLEKLHEGHFGIDHTKIVSQ